MTLWSSALPSGRCLRRQLAADVLDLMALLTDFLATGGRSYLWRPSYPRLTAYNMAVYRLRRQGLLASRGGGAAHPVLKLTDAGQQRVSLDLFPERWWNQRWTGTWYLLAYDIPERHRTYRMALQRFLRHTRMGCLQKSVYVSPRDIRPLYGDLSQAAAIRDYARLFEARLAEVGDPVAIVEQAWPMERLRAAHAAYVNAGDPHAGRGSAPGMAGTLTRLRAELLAYRQAMQLDPWLPKALWPPEYRGPEVVAVFRRRLRRHLLPAFTRAASHSASAGA